MKKLTMRRAEKIMNHLIKKRQTWCWLGNKVITLQGLSIFIKICENK